MTARCDFPSQPRLYGALRKPPIEPVPSSLRLTTKRGVTLHPAGITRPEGYPDGASVTRVIAVDLSAGEKTPVVEDFPFTLEPSSLRVEGRGAPNSPLVDRRPAATRGAAGQSARARQAHRDAERRTRQPPGRHRRRYRAAHIRRAICGDLAGRTGGKGRGAADRRMARRVCGRRRGSRDRQYRDPRRRTQAARHRPRDRAAGIGPGAEAAEQDSKCGSTSPQLRRPRRRCG